MVLTVQELKQTANKIGSLGFGDAYYVNIFELWQSGDTYYQREIYYAGDDAGYDKVEEITKEQANELIEDDDFYREYIPDKLKTFIQNNRGICERYAAEHFAGDIYQAAEYLLNQI